MATGRLGTTPVLRTRWSKEPAGGTTSLSGLDDYSVSLVYEVGYEAVYQNGALLSRGNDYTATDGTTITLTNATVAGDIIEVFANNVVPLTDTYSQSVADGKFVNNTIVDAKGDLIVGSAADTFVRLPVGSANQVLTVDSATTSGLKWATAGGGAFTFISRTTFSNVASQAFDNVFTSTYQKYFVTLDNMSAATSGDDLQLQFRYAGPTTQTANYFGYLNNASYNSTTAYFQINGAPNVTICNTTGSASGANQQGAGYLFFSNVGNNAAKAIVRSEYFDSTNAGGSEGGCQADDQRTYTGFLLKSSSTNITGTVTIYGLANS